MAKAKKRLRGPEAGGVDPRLLEAREAQREVESASVVAQPTPARLDPKLAEIRKETIKREKELAGRSLTKPPARA